MAQDQKPPVPGPDKSRNEYIPAFISKRPFWAETTHSSDTDYLEHQRLQSESKDTLDKAKWYDRGKKLGPAATKFRKGACENCGAMTHKTKECLSRPRKQGARWTGKDIAADEVVEDVRLGWDAKRDRWNGYDSREYSGVVKEFEELEALKRSTAGNKTNPEDPDDEARYAEETDMGRSQPTSTRQLRLREDTAAYLKNLDLESARYDPKTRSMDKSAQLQEEQGDVDVSEGFVRPANDDAAEFERAQQYAWETEEQNKNNTKKLHLQANPTEGEILRKKQTTETAEKKAAARKALLDRYGGDEYLSSQAANKKAFKPSLLVANERYVEYDEHGHIKGSSSSTHPIARSKYAEDIYTHNHTSVWGSWWRDFAWGYACCHSMVKNSYCTGEEGRKAWEESEEMRTGEALLAIEGAADADADQRPEEEEEYGQKEEDIDKEVQEKKPQQPALGTRKRALHEVQSGISEEELESYKRSRLAADDPMAKMLGRDELIEMK